MVGGDLIMPLAAQVDARRRVGCMSPATGPALSLIHISQARDAAAPFVVSMTEPPPMATKPSQPRSV